MFPRAWHRLQVFPRFASVRRIIFPRLAPNLTIFPPLATHWASTESLRYLRQLSGVIAFAGLSLT